MRRVRLVVIFLAIVLLAFWAYKLSSEGDTNSKMSDEALSDFAIEDTASIDKLILTDTEGNAGVTLIRNGGTWTQESGECVQQHLVHTMLGTIKYIKVKSPVPKSSLETINKNLTTHHRKVEIYTNGVLNKTWYVGQPTQDQYGTYMLLKDPEKGKSPEPFIMYQPNMYGNLEVRFITNPLEFACTGVFNIDPTNVASIDVQRPDSSMYSFTLHLEGDNLFSMTRDGQEIPKFDTSNARIFTVAFKKIHFEQHNYLLNEYSVDSIKKATPWFVWTVTDKKGNVRTASAYKKKMVYEKYDFNNELIEYDRDRLWVITNDGELVVGQYYVFDKILQDIRTFVHPKDL